MRALLFFIAMTIGPSALADPNPSKTPPPQGEVEIAKAQLQTLVKLLDSIRRPIERFNLGGWVVLRKQVDAIAETIDRNHGVGNDETGKAYRDLVTQIESSKDYFPTIQTDDTKEDIRTLQKMSDDLRAQKKMPKTNYGQNTFELFSKIQELIDSLTPMPISPQLREGLINLNPQLKSVFAQNNAQGGDRPKTYDEGKKAVLAIRKLYPLFFEAGVDNQIFTKVSLIQGYVEQYAFIANMAVLQKDEDGAQR